jgi:hypothetical protein
MGKIGRTSAHCMQHVYFVGMTPWHSMRLLQSTRLPSCPLPLPLQCGCLVYLASFLVSPLQYRWSPPKWQPQLLPLLAPHLWMPPLLAPPMRLQFSSAPIWPPHVLLVTGSLPEYRPSVTRCPATAKAGLIGVWLIARKIQKMSIVSAYRREREG